MSISDVPLYMYVPRLEKVRAHFETDGIGVVWLELGGQRYTCISTAEVYYIASGSSQLDGKSLLCDFLLFA